MMTPEGKWYAIHTRSHFEQKVYDGLTGKSLEAFFPRIQVMSRRKDRRKKILVPMLPGYVFVRTALEPEAYWRIIKTVGVVRMVGFRGNVVSARDEEIGSLMILDCTDRTVQNQAYIKAGDRVMIMDGPFKGLAGYYLRHKGSSDRVVVSVELLRRSLAVEIEDWALEKVS
ncbi:MAG: UpxY family transcription antiterminator [Deltaproteobacteria bacterium]|nr:UpxY family transcription antiterminator [Deltaproteobacteria bacterium]MBW1816340.1 UpxY family transcription antiterminator [Deltaproteobacteria bacterium]MBW2284601.1 UpxY family transcription antiterminator [Deltaproteobacteria bacterium]